MHHLVSALGSALVLFVFLGFLVGYYVPRMKVFVLAYDQPIVLKGRLAHGGTPTFVLPATLCSPDSPWNLSHPVKPVRVLSYPSLVINSNRVGEMVTVTYLNKYKNVKKAFLVDTK